MTSGGCHVLQESIGNTARATQNVKAQRYDMSCHTLYKFRVRSVCCPAHKTVFDFMPNTSQKLFSFTIRCSYSALQIVPGYRHLRNGHRVLHKAPEKCSSDVRSGDRGGWHINLPVPQRNNISSTACYGLLSRHCINVLAPVILKNKVRFLIYKAKICRSKIHKINLLFTPTCFDKTPPY
jgi:hypothetical protein